MVFYQPPKRRNGDRRADVTLTMTHLPDEINLQILDYLRTSDIVQARRVCSDLVRVGNTILRNRLKTLYLHPKGERPLHAVEVCFHPEFRLEIEEVIIVGNINWQRLEQTYPGSRSNVQYPPNKTSIAAQSDSCFRTWPSHFPQKKDYTLPYSDGVQAMPAAKRPSTIESRGTQRVLDRFQETYTPLIDALVNLPKLRRLRFAEASDIEGFCPMRQSTIASHAYNCESKTITNAVFAEETDPRLLESTRRFADMEILFGVLSDPRLQITSFRQDAELPFVEDLYEGLVRSPLSTDHLRMQQLANLSSLDLYIDCGWRFHPRKAMYRVLVETCTPHLRRLRLAFGPNASVKHSRDEDVVTLLLEGLWLPRLEALHLELLEPTTGSLVHVDNPGQKRRSLRPTCQSFDIVSFLSMHSNSLIEIFFKNVIFSDPSEGVEEPKDTLLMIKDTREQLKKGTKLERVVWDVSHYKHDRRCKRMDNDPLTDCSKYQCGIYDDDFITPLSATVEDFEVRAAIMGVSLDIERGVWDFAEGVLLSDILGGLQLE